MKSHVKGVTPFMLEQFRDERQRHAGELVKIAINTRVPSKWLLVDLETGQVYQHLHAERDPAHQLKGVDGVSVRILKGRGKRGKQ